MEDDLTQNGRRPKNEDDQKMKTTKRLRRPKNEDDQPKNEDDQPKNEDDQKMKTTKK